MIIIGFCQCNNNSSLSEKDNKENQPANNSTLDYDYYDEDGNRKAYHVDTLNELIPTKLIDDKYDGFIVGDNVRLRASADVKSDMVAELSNGLLLKILGKTDKEYILLKGSYCDETYGSPWINVETIDGQKGWIFGKFVYKVENLKHETINEYQGKIFEFNNEKYRFGYAVDFSHPFMDNTGLSLCDDLGILFFHKTGEQQIRPIIVKKPETQRISLEQNKKGFWHFVNYSDHFYEVKELENKIQFKYHACVQAGSIDGVIQVEFQNDQFYAKYLEYDDHDGYENSFSEISDVKNNLFKYFEPRSDIRRLLISGNDYSDGLLIKYNSGDPRKNKGKVIPTQFVDDFDLYHLDIDQESNVTKIYKLGKEDAVVRGYYRRSYKDYEILLYSVTVGTATSEAAATDVRLLIIGEGGTIQKNIFVAGNVIEEGESIVDRSITLKPEGIELKIENEENYLYNIPKHLKLKPIEIIEL